MKSKKHYLNLLSRPGAKNNLLGLKKILAVVLAFECLFSMSSCKQGDESTVDSSTNTEIQLTTSVTELVSSSTQLNLTIESTSAINEIELQYEALRNEYNSLVNDYNIQIQKTNSLIEKLSTLNINGLKKLDTQPTNEQTYAEYKMRETDLSQMNQSVETVRESVNRLQINYQDICQEAYDSAIHNYNVLAKGYNLLSETTSVSFIKGLIPTIIYKSRKSIEVDEDNYKEEDLLKSIEKIKADTDELAGEYQILSQITNPTQQWVISRLSGVKSIVGTQPVTTGNDPNGLYGKQGGYTCCVYFTTNKIDASSIPGESIVAKGTDAGGAIEVYASLDDAKNRCDYLSQFDNTLLYSGSYVLVGTMVIRTSYKLSNQEQIDLTNEIITSFTEIKA